MRVLVACEYSGRVRDAFIAKGHYALSCDLLPTEHKGPHYQGDVFDILYGSWDMLIAFPPCTHLCVSGARWFKDKVQKQAEALDFVRRLLLAPIQYIALENPVGVISTYVWKPTQIIQPYMFGHDASKRTCLWLKNLPDLQSTSYVSPRIVNGKKRWGNQFDSGQNNQIGLANRAHVRSETYQGIADAMAEQWNI